jgi:TBC1 domain family member 2
VWGIRHPATGYVQGVNDLATPFLYIFLSERLGECFCLKSQGGVARREGVCPDLDSGCEDVPMEFEDISDAELLNIEADAYHCLTRLLDRALVCAPPLSCWR